MSDTLSITFSRSGCTLDLGAARTGFEGTAQSTLVNLVTNAGSDRIFEERGTTLLRDAVSGAAIIGNRATHISNIAALETQNFMRLNSTDPTQVDEIANILLQPAVLKDRILHLATALTSVGGEVIPLNAQL